MSVNITHRIISINLEYTILTLLHTYTHTFIMLNVRILSNASEIQLILSGKLAIALNMKTREEEGEDGRASKTLERTVCQE